MSCLKFDEMLKKMRKFDLLLISFFSLILCMLSSCSKNTVIYQATESTVRDAVKDSLKDISWQEELESPQNYEVNLSKVNSAFPDGVLAALPKTKIYPSYQDFGSLDTSELEGSLLRMLDSFLSKAAFASRENRTVDSKCLDPSYPFLSAVLLPLFQELPFTAKAIYGKPFFMQDCIEVPVRLKGDKIHKDLLLYVLKDKEVWYIEQVVFGEQINE